MIFLSSRLNLSQPHIFPKSKKCLGSSASLSHKKKTAGPSTTIEFQGIKLNMLKFQASLPKEKIDRTILIASSLIDTPNCFKRELLSITGNLNLAMCLIPQGHPFVARLLSLASSAHALEDLIHLTSSSSDELSLGIKFLKQWNGMSFFYNDLVSLPIDILLLNDAGFEGFYQDRWFTYTWPPQLTSLPQPLASSALF